jgi:hypothetical protein
MEIKSFNSIKTSVVLSGFFHHKFFLAGHHNIAEILLKVALNTKNQINQKIMN